MNRLTNERGAVKGQAGLPLEIKTGALVAHAGVMSMERFTRKEVVTAEPDEPASAVAQRMSESHVGAVIITDLGRPIGIVTDRDLALRVLGEGRSSEVPVHEVMSRELVTARVGDGVDGVVSRMRATGVRRLPIVGMDGSLVGLVSLDDLFVLLSGELSASAGAVLDNRGP
jgi:CBS domain-containing protein